MKKLSLIVCTALILCSCSDYVEVNDKSFVIAMGMDEGENGMLKVSFLFTSPQVNSGEGGGGEKPNEKDIVTLEAPTIYSAMRIMNTFKSKITDISHLKLIVFSEKIAKKGIEDYITDFVNSRSFRPNVYLCVCRGKAESFFKAMNPKQDVFIEKYIERLMGKFVSDDVNEAYLYYTYFNLCSDTGGGLLPLVGVAGEENEEKSENNKTDESTVSAYAFSSPSDDFSANYTAEEIPLNAKGKAAVGGYAVFGRDKMISTLGLAESELARLITFNYPSGDFSVYYPDKKKYISIHLYQTQKPKISVVAKDEAQIKIDVRLWCEITGVSSAFTKQRDYENFSVYLNNAMTRRLKELLKRTQTEFSADVFHFGNKAKLGFLTNARWERYDWDEKYKSAKISCNVVVELNDYGEIRQSPSKKGGTDSAT